MQSRQILLTVLAITTLAALGACGRQQQPEHAASPAPTAGRTENVFTPQQLAERAVHRRAIEAVIWGVPAVNFELMRDALVKAKGDWNQIVYWSRLPDWKNQTLTPNPDVIYLIPFYDTRNGRQSTRQRAGPGD